MVLQANNPLPRHPANPSDINTFGLIAMLITRKDVGFGFITAPQLLIIPATIIAVPKLFNIFSGEPLSIWLLATLAGLAFVRAVYLRQRHWRGIVDGIAEAAHCYDTGDSIIAPRLGVAATLQGIIDPLALILAGGLILHFLSTPVGLFLLFCGGCQAVAEFKVWQRTKEALLHTHDGVRDAQRHGRVAGHVAEQYSSSRTERAENIGTPTGVAEDIEFHLARRN